MPQRAAMQSVAAIPIDWPSRLGQYWANHGTFESSPDALVRDCSSISRVTSLASADRPPFSPTKRSACIVRRAVSSCR